MYDQTHISSSTVLHPTTVVAGSPFLLLHVSMIHALPVYDYLDLIKASLSSSPAFCTHSTCQMVTATYMQSEVLLRGIDCSVAEVSHVVSSLSPHDANPRPFQALENI